MDEKKLDAIVIGTQGNYSWLSGGGRSNVLITSEGADGLLVVTKNSNTLIAYNMDGDRNRDEELGNLGFELVKTHWIEKSREEIATDMLKGKKFLADIPLEGAIVDSKQFYELIYPLTDFELERYREVARDSELILLRVIEKIQPGFTEKEIERLIVAEFALQGFVSTVVLIGSGERLIKYRHPIPSDKQVEDTLMFVLCPRKYGLHVPITRTIRFQREVGSRNRKTFYFSKHNRRKLYCPVKTRRKICGYSSNAKAIV